MTLSDPAVILDVSHLSFTHTGQDKPLFSDLSFQLRNGELLCVAGANGSGKSTLLCLLAGVSLGSQEGKITIRETAANGQDPALPLDMEYVRLLLQDADMQIIGNTVEEDIMLGIRYKTKEKQEREQLRKKAYALARQFQLADDWQTHPQRLSYGQKRKLCIAAALMHDPRLLLLDEPFSGLDYPGAHELLNVLQALLRNNIAIVASVHDLTDLKPLISRVLLLGRGLAPRFGPLDSMKHLFSHYQIKPFE